MTGSALFSDRTDAGRRLAARLAEDRYEHPIIYAMPRGGVPVAAEVATALDTPLDLVLVRKLGVPFQPELAFGALVDGPEPEVVLNQDVVEMSGITAGQIDAIRNREAAENERRRNVYMRGRERLDPHGRDVIVIDDGLATGASAIAAVRALKRRGSARVILAIPVAPVETLERVRKEADLVVCLESPSPFWSIGQWYGDFHQLEDEDVIAAIAAVGRRRRSAAGPSERGGAS